MSSVAGPEVGDDRAGREDDGERYSLQALEFARQKGLREASGAALNDLGEHARARAAWADATRYYEEALALARESGARGQAALALLNLAYVARNTGDLDGAVRRISEVLDLEREIGLEVLVWFALAVLAGVLSVAGRPREGARCLV